MFELTPNGSGGWTEKVLHNFGNGTDGADPAAGLIFDAAGNLYGTTSVAALPATAGCGTVFELTPNGSGGWTEKMLHSFGNGTDGTLSLRRPDLRCRRQSLRHDQRGRCITAAGTVFELTPNGNGGWTEKKLYTFGRDTDGAYPYAGLIFDTAGNLYGTTRAGGIYHAAKTLDAERCSS